MNQTYPKYLYVRKVCLHPEVTLPWLCELTFWFFLEVVSSYLCRNVRNVLSLEVARYLEGNSPNRDNCSDPTIPKFSRSFSKITIYMAYWPSFSCSVKMAGYRPSSFLASLWTETESRTWPISGHLHRTSLVIKGFIIWLSGKFFLRDTAGSPEQAR